MTAFPIEDARLRICPLREGQIDQTFAGLELTGLPIDLEAWRRYAAGRIGAGSSSAGILTLQCARGYVHGVLGYEVVRLGAERRMTVDLFRTVDYVSEKTTGSLMSAAEAIAARQGCVAIHLDLADFSDASVIALKPRSLALLCRAGFAVESIQLFKSLRDRAGNLGAGPGI